MTEARVSSILVVEGGRLPVFVTDWDLRGSAAPFFSGRRISDSSGGRVMTASSRDVNRPNSLVMQAQNLDEWKK